MVKKAILSDVRILDMTTVMFGPYCTETLANMGAEVIKLEPSGGDEARRVGKPRRTRRMGPLHLTMNRGKRSIDWDIKSEKGAADLRALIPTCDIVIHNLREQAAIRAGLNYESVRALRPDIIHVHCTGFGKDGPYAGRPAYDDIIQALSGTASLHPMVTGQGPPRFLPTALADKVSGLHAAYAVLAALYHREHSGEGQTIEVPMFETVTHFLLQEHMYGRVFDPPNAPAGYPRQLDPDRQPMATRDGHIVIAPYTDERWLRLFTLLGRADLFEQEALSTPLLRLQNVALMQRALEAILVEKDSAEWLNLMQRHDIPACRVNGLDDLFDDPHLRAVGFFEKLTHPTEGEYVGMRAPVRFGAGAERKLIDARAIGEDSDAVRKELDR
ncbi:CaiB/BaiF CoA-transferase family protein [Sphingobium sp. 15-1]|uniref:CaiB/BaiF CoA transferase family protein n=1 Tax=Sphingobium sp. 15-1 TaxID=2729616 RepID=UPI00159C4AB7|nr:CoA transferase [Sphingobium sp. 15-1]